MARRDDAHIALSGAGDLPNSVSAGTLSRVLEATQQAVYVLAADSEGVSAAHRFRVSRTLEEKYTIFCSVPIAGSYAVPVHLNPRQRPLANPLVLDTVGDALRAVLEGNSDFFHEITPNSILRARLSRVILDMLPSREEAWQLRYEGPSREPVVLRGEDRGFLESEIERAEAVTETSAAIGVVDSVRFKDTSLELAVQGRPRSLRVHYPAQQEKLIYSWARHAVEVHGRIEITPSGIPTKIVGVTRIVAVDLSDVNPSGIRADTGRVRLHRPLSIPVRLDESGQLYVAERSDLALHAFAPTREELESEVESELAFLWANYAHAPTETLAPDARLIQVALRELAPEDK